MAVQTKKKKERGNKRCLILSLHSSYSIIEENASRHYHSQNITYSKCVRETELLPAGMAVRLALFEVVCLFLAGLLTVGEVATPSHQEGSTPMFFKDSEAGVQKPELETQAAVEGLGASAKEPSWLVLAFFIWRIVDPIRSSHHPQMKPNCPGCAGTETGPWPLPLCVWACRGGGGRVRESRCFTPAGSPVYETWRKAHSPKAIALSNPKIQAIAFLRKDPMWEF